jgi:hypothetical protein
MAATQKPVASVKSGRKTAKTKAPRFNAAV